MIIYLITNRINGKQYVGQTRGSLQKRWTAHCSNAKRGRSMLICRSIRKYGKDNFCIEVIDSANSLIELNKKEAFHAKRLNTYHPNGYNTDECGVQLMGKEWTEKQSRSHSKQYRFISPEGQITEIENLSKFCEQNNLDKCHMYKVAQGLRVAHRGWRNIVQNHCVWIIENKLSNEKREVIDAYGFKRKIANELGILESQLNQLIYGTCKSARGWILKEQKTLNGN